MEGGAAFTNHFEIRNVGSWGEFDDIIIHANGTYCASPPLDLDGDCVVHLGDLAMLANAWLDCGYINPLYCP